MWVNWDWSLQQRVSMNALRVVGAGWDWSQGQGVSMNAFKVVSAGLDSHSGTALTIHALRVVDAGWDWSQWYITYYTNLESCRCWMGLVSVVRHLQYLP